MFACRLALALGVPDPYQLLEELPASTFRLWAAYARLEPWRLEDEPARVGPLPPPERVADQVRAAMLMAARAKGRR